jgi:rod shape determining protein RodA
MRRVRDLPVGDPLLLGLVLLLSIFGVAMVYSAGVLDVPSTIVVGLWRMQLLWFVLALVLIPIVLWVPVVWLEYAAWPMYAVALVLLALTLVIGGGAGTAESMTGWIRIGPVGLQTSEMAKVAVIIALAKVLSEWREAPQTMWGLWKPIGVVLVPMGLVMLQPDLGTALVFSSILFASLFWAGTPLRTLFLLGSPALGLLLAFSTWVWGVWIVGLSVAIYFMRPRLSEAVAVMLANVAAGTVALTLWNTLAPYQRNRFLVFLDPTVDPRGAGYNLIQSQVAIGSGGVWGKGFLDGTQKRLAFLPEQHTDFIFAVIGEEWGFIGVALVLVAFGLIFWRLVTVSEQSSDPFASIIPFGLFGSWFAHVLVNTGMTVGIMPITGIPLPFLSYGGSFLMVNLLAMAMVQRIAAEAKR